MTTEMNTGHDHSLAAVKKERFDLPDASCIVIARPTMSFALYLQMVGRGLHLSSVHRCVEHSKSDSLHNVIYAGCVWPLC